MKAALGVIGVAVLAAAAFLIAKAKATPAGTNAAPSGKSAAGAAALAKSDRTKLAVSLMTKENLGTVANLFGTLVGGDGVAKAAPGSQLPLVPAQQIQSTSVSAGWNTSDSSAENYG